MYDKTNISLFDFNQLPAEFDYGALANNPYCEQILKLLNIPLPAFPEGITLAWILANCNRWDLLNILVTKSSNVLVDLNAAPQAESHFDKGITLAWILAGRNQWDLLNTFAEKNPSVVADLNAAPQAESHRNKGITLAWIIAHHNRWNLLKTLAEKKPHVIDLNAAPQAESDPAKGITLAWKLADYSKWDLLKTLADNNPNVLIDLNAAPQAESHTGKGITLALLLTTGNQWDLLKTFAEKNSNVVIDLNAAPQAKSHPSYGFTLCRALIDHKQWDLLKTLISQNYVHVEDNYLTSLKEMSSDPTFRELLILIELEHQEIMISNLIINYLHLIKDKNSEEQKTFNLYPEEQRIFNLLEKAIQCSQSCISQLDKTSSYYQKAHTIKAHILLNTQQLPNPCKEKLLPLFPKISSHFSAVNHPTHQLLLLQMEAVIEAGNTQLGIEIMAERLKELEGMTILTERSQKENNTIQSSVQKTTALDSFFADTSGRSEGNNFNPSLQGKFN